MLDSPSLPESLATQAYLLLEREIVTLRLAPGQMLTEATESRHLSS